MKLSNERGISMVITLLSVLILSTLGASIIFLTQTEIRTSYNYKLLTQGRYAAEAGLQRTLYWMRNGYTQPTSFNNYNMTTSPVQWNGSSVVLSAMSGMTANYPNSAVQTAFNTNLNAQAVTGMGVTATYSTAATLESMRVVMQVGNIPMAVQVWNVVTRGDVDSGPDALVEIESVVENVPRPAFGFAAFGVAPVCGSITWGGGSITNSYNSLLGTYAQTMTNSQGNIGSNGNVLVNGMSTVVNGSSSSPRGGSGSCTAFSLPGLEITGGAVVTGGQQVLAAPLSFPAPPAASPLPPTNNQNVAGPMNLCNEFTTGCTETMMGNLRLDPGGYGNVSITSGNILHLTAGTYDFNSLNLSGGAQIVVDSGPVVLRLTGQGITGPTPVLNMSGGSEINNSLMSAKELQILYGGGQPISLSGGANSYGVVYAPLANLALTGNSEWFGSVVGRTVNAGGGIQLHYDVSLGDDFYIRGEYRPLSFNWKKY